MKDGVFGRAYDEMELLERHIRMLTVTKDNQPIGLTRLSEMLDIPKHKVRYSLRLLENDGLISATSEGAVVTEYYEEFMKSLAGRLDSLADMVVKMKTETAERP
jgi:predicted transcriptional regulator